jgi:hypothetical protein
MDSLANIAQCAINVRALRDDAFAHRAMDGCLIFDDTLCRTKNLRVPLV